MIYDIVFHIVSFSAGAVFGYIICARLNAATVDYIRRWERGRWR